MKEPRKVITINGEIFECQKHYDYISQMDNIMDVDSKKKLLASIQAQIDELQEENQFTGNCLAGIIEINELYTK